MKSTCPLSNTNFYTKDLIRPATTCLHPIFSLPVKQLYNLVSDYHANRLDVPSKKLLFLAFMQSTGLIEWRGDAAADPSPQVVESNFVDLVSICGWLHSLHTPQVKFPHYLVSKQNKDLNNIKYWLEALRNVRDNYDNYSRMVDRQQRINKRAELLDIMFKRRAAGQIRWLNAKVLADWALEASDAPKSQLERWKIMLCMTKDELQLGVVKVEDKKYRVSEQSLQEMYDHMEEYLPIGTVQRTEVLKYIKQCIRTMRVGLGIFEILETEDDAGNTINYVTSGAGDDTATEAPVEPKQEHYLTKTAYLIAHARWILAYGKWKQQHEEDTSLIAAVEQAAKQDLEEELEADEEELVADVDDAMRNGLSIVEGEDDE